jgi:hypothetical protein
MLIINLLEFFNSLKNFKNMKTNHTIHNNGFTYIQFTFNIIFIQFLWYFKETLRYYIY